MERPKYFNFTHVLMVENLKWSQAKWTIITSIKAEFMGKLLY